MANWDRWGVAAGLAGALMLFGTARAQTPGTGNDAGTSQQGDTTGRSPGERSGWSGSTATEPGTTSSQGSTSPSDASGGTTSSSREGSMGSTPSSTGKVDEKIQDDLQKVHAANQGEIHMAQMGQQQATSPEVKQYAQTLEQDHEQMDRLLTQTAQTLGVTLEGKSFTDKQKDAQKEMRKLQAKTGQDFDKQYLKMMVKDHEKDIKDVRKIAKDARKNGQTELASALDDAVTKMQGHLQQAKQLESSVGKGSSRQGRRSTSGSTGSSSGGSSMGGSSSGDMNGGSSSTGAHGSRPSDGATGATDSHQGSSGSSSSHDTGNTGDASHARGNSSGQ